MKLTIRQYSCVEGDKADYRQANSVLKYRPDIIIYEMPEKNGKPDLIFNKYAPNKKPLKEVDKRIEGMKEAAKTWPYAISEARTWENIRQLWQEGHDVLLFNVDAPRELRAEFYEVWNHMYPCAKKNWLWWVQIYLRERIMANHMEKILADLPDDKKLTMLMFLQSFHWDHVKFLLTKPNKEEIWDYYFGKFQKEVTVQNIEAKIKNNNKIFSKYWAKYSDFR